MKNKIVEISIYIAIIICFGINFYLGLLAIFSLAIFDNLKNPPDITPSPNKQIYQKKYFMTSSEKIFYQKIMSFNKDYVVIPQLNLASINEKKDAKYRTELFRNVDYAIFSKNFDILLLIELNDITHKNKKRYERDQKVKEILKTCNIPLLTFYTSYPNEEQYVIDRINTTLKNNYPSLLENKMINNNQDNSQSKAQ